MYERIVSFLFESVWTVCTHCSNLMLHIWTFFSFCAFLSKNDNKKLRKNKAVIKQSLTRRKTYDKRICSCSKNNCTKHDRNLIASLFLKKLTMSRCSSSFSSSESDTESTEPVGQENEIEVVETRKKTGSYFEEWVFLEEAINLWVFSVAFVPSDNKDDQEKDAEPVPPISFFAVYRYADTLDYMLLIVGTVLCLVQVLNCLIIFTLMKF